MGAVCEWAGVEPCGGGEGEECGERGGAHALEVQEERPELAGCFRESGVDAEFRADELDACDHVGEFLFRGPASGLAESAVRGEGELVGFGELETAADAFCDPLGGFDEVAFDVDDADADIAVWGDGGDDVEFCEFAASHFEVDFVEMEVEEGREERGVAAGADGAGFEVAEAEVGTEAAAAGDAFDGAVEDVDEAAGVFAVAVAAHGRFIDGDFGAACGDEVDEFLADGGEEGFGEGPAVGVLGVSEETPAECVGAGDAAFEDRAGRGDALEALEFGDGAETARGGEVAGDAVFAALVVGGRAPAAR